MSNKVREHILVILLVFTLSGCAGPAIAPGDVLPLQPGYTLQAVERATQGLIPLAKALYHQPSGTYLIAWPGAENTWNVVCVNSVCPNWMYQVRPQGMAMRTEDISAIIKIAIAAKWHEVVVTGIPMHMTPVVFPLFEEQLPKGAPQT